MSDGITEGYRATRASENFERLWENAQIENILLDLKKDIEHLSIENLVVRLTDLANKLELQTYDRFLIKYDNKPYFVQSIDPRQPHEVVRRYCVSGSFNGVHRKFESNLLIDSLRECYLFAQWVYSEEGKAAVVLYNDW